MTDFKLESEPVGPNKKPAKPKPKAKTKDKNHGFYSFMVSSFCSDTTKITFIFQYKQAKKLFELFPHKDFWIWLKGEGHKIYSLKEWLKPNKIEWLKFQIKKSKLNLSNKKTYVLENKPIGENKKGLKLRKSLIDFTDNE
jgi:hypothetical protein